MHPAPPIVLGLIAAACAAPPGPAEGGSVSVERRLVAMGTFLSVEVEAPSRSAALRASERAVRALEAVEERLSTWREDSELARLNRTPVGTAFPLSEELAADLTRARHFWRETGGAFDPGVGLLVEAWGLRSGGRRPSAAELAAFRAGGGLASLEFDGRTALRRHGACRIEEGGFGKGIGLDAALAALREEGVGRAVLDLGGQVAVLGAGEPFTFGVSHPRDRARTAIEIEIDRGSLATSGNAERGIVVDGVRRSHVLDPRTAEPAADFGSVTVWARDATTADCLSTALYVLGPDGALSWARAHHGVEVLVLETAGSGLVARATAGLRARLHAVDGGPGVQFEAPQETTATAQEKR